MLNEHLYKQKKKKKKTTKKIQDSLDCPFVPGIYQWSVDFHHKGPVIRKVCSPFQGWRWAFYICGIPGIILGIILFFTIREPTRRQRRKETNVDDEESHNGICSQLGSTMRVALSHFLTCDVFSLCLATALRKAGKWRFRFIAVIMYCNNTYYWVGWVA